MNPILPIPALFLCALLCSCETSFYSARTGRKIFSTHADLEQVVIRITIPGEGTYLLTAARVNHSRPASVAWHGIGTAGGQIILSGIPYFRGVKTAAGWISAGGSTAGQFRPAPTLPSTPAPKATPIPKP